MRILKLVSRKWGERVPKEVSPPLGPKPLKELLPSIQWRSFPDRLHVGCGQVNLTGWLNLDLDSPKADFLWDLRDGLPCPDASMRFIYSEHLLEHLSLQEGMRFLKECLRVLKLGGVLRIAMPDLDYIVAKFMDDWKDQDWLRWPEYQFVETRVQMINMAFREWQHQYLYNREELELRLKQSGFEKVEFFENGQSRHEELCGLETRKDSILIAEGTR